MANKWLIRYHSIFGYEREADRSEYVEVQDGQLPEWLKQTYELQDAIVF